MDSYQSRFYEENAKNGENGRIFPRAEVRLRLFFQRPPSGLCLSRRRFPDENGGVFFGAPLPEIRKNKIMKKEVNAMTADSGSDPGTKGNTFNGQKRGSAVPAVKA